MDPTGKLMIPDRELACSRLVAMNSQVWEGYNFSLMGELWNTLVPMLEVHITSNKGKGIFIRMNMT